MKIIKNLSILCFTLIAFFAIQSSADEVIIEDQKSCVKLCTDYAVENINGGEFKRKYPYNVECERPRADPVGGKFVVCQCRVYFWWGTANMPFRLNGWCHLTNSLDDPVVEVMCNKPPPENNKDCSYYENIDKP